MCTCFVSLDFDVCDDCIFGRICRRAAVLTISSLGERAALLATLAVGCKWSRLDAGF